MAKTRIKHTIEFRYNLSVDTFKLCQTTSSHINKMLIVLTKAGKLSCYILYETKKIKFNI